MYSDCLLDNLFQEETLGNLKILLFNNYKICFGYKGLNGNQWNVLKTPEFNKMYFIGATYDGENQASYSARTNSNAAIEIRPHGVGYFGTYIIAILK